MFKAASLAGKQTPSRQHVVTRLKSLLYVCMGVCVCVCVFLFCNEYQGYQQYSYMCIGLYVECTLKVKSISWSQPMERVIASAKQNKQGSRHIHWLKSNHIVLCDISTGDKEFVILLLCYTFLSGVAFILPRWSSRSRHIQGLW